jgi:hypothetical protein
LTPNLNVKAAAFQLIDGEFVRNFFGWVLMGLAVRVVEAADTDVGGIEKGD